MSFLIDKEEVIYHMRQLIFLPSRDSRSSFHFARPSRLLTVEQPCSLSLSELRAGDPTLPLGLFPTYLGL